MAQGRWKTLASDFDTAMARLPEALAAEGFGIVSQIDLQATFKAKLGVDHPRYRILGACNPKLAHEAVTRDPQIGVLLPCNVVLYEDAAGKAVLGAIDPMQSIGGRDGAEFQELAKTVAAKLERVVDGMS